MARIGPRADHVRASARSPTQAARIWIAKGVGLTLGGVAPAALHALAAVTPLHAARFPARVASVRAESDELTLLLRSGLEVRLGDARGVPLKLAVAAKVLPLVPRDTRYLDVSVPERPVAGSLIHPPPAATAARLRRAPASCPRRPNRVADKPSSLNLRLMVQARPDLEIGVDNADKEVVPWRRTTSYSP